MENKANNRSQQNRTDRLIMLISLLGLFLVALPLASDRMYQVLFGSNQEENDSPAIGEIVMIQNDIRHKSGGTLAWGKANKSQPIRVGDSVFTGNRSKSLVTLRNGQRLDLGENSMVTFNKVNNVEIPTLEMGNFLISGSARVVIGGEVVAFEGQDSQVQVIMDKKNRPTVKLIRGKARTIVKNQVQELKAEAPTVLPTVKSAAIKVEAPRAIVILLPASPEESFRHTDEFNDFYRRENDQWVLRSERKKYVPYPLEVSWRIEGPVDEVQGQLSSTDDFAQIAGTLQQKAPKTFAEFKSAFLGQNFVRLSTDGRRWQSQQSFWVDAKPLLQDSPRQIFTSRRLFILDQPVLIEAHLEQDPTLLASVVEVSDQSQFPPVRTQVRWITDKQFKLSSSQAQTLYIRSRGVNEKYQVTAYSETARITVEKPNSPEMPRLAIMPTPYFEGDIVTFEWSKSAGAAQYEIMVHDRHGKTVLKKKVDGLTYQAPAHKEGQYRFTVTAIDRFGRKSETPLERFRVVKKPLPLAPPREPATETRVTQTLEPELPNYLNRNFPSSTLALEGAAFTVFSSDQIDAGTGNPVPLMLGARWMGWSDLNGFEGLVKLKAVNVVAPEGSQISPFQMEARYHRRKFFGFNPLSMLGMSQVSIFLGAEHYRNSAAGLFSPKYDLLKAGLRFAFPLMKRWDTGGEFTYGLGLDQSKKYEISGYLHYYIQRNWSMGVGYRMHLFEAGSESSAPNGLPFREGFGEGYSVLRWHY